MRGRRGERRFEVSVAEPCSESWEGMRVVPGGARGGVRGSARHCDSCAKAVHDLAAMTPGQVELLAMRAAAGDAVCGRVTRRADGVLVMLEEGARAGRAGGVLLSAAMMAGLPLAAQAVGNNDKSAVITGTLLKPDGSPVESGLVRLGGFLYVADDRGRFEMHVAPGVYDVVVQTGEKEGEHVSSVTLHAGEQSFGEVRTVVGDAALSDEITTTSGSMIATYTWSWKGRLRHPLLYARSVARGHF